MSERKVLNKYYPPEYHESKLPRNKHPKNQKISARFMAPFNMKCNKCNAYIAQATKFNAKKETVPDPTYKELSVYRFFLRCKEPYCDNTIIIRTNNKEKDYEVESGATESYATLKRQARAIQEEQEAEEEEEQINPMKQLEKRTKESQKRIEASEQIQNMRNVKRQQASVDIEQLLEKKRRRTSHQICDEEIEAEKRETLKRKALEFGSTVSKKNNNKKMGSLF